MKNYGCPKCGSVDVFIEPKGNQTGLYCSEGCGWIKWIPKKELPLVERFINENKKEKSYETDINSQYKLMTLKDYLKQKKFELEIENNSYNRGVVKGIELSLAILEAKM